MKKFHFLPLIILFIFSCAPSRLIKERETRITSSNHGYVILDFRAYTHIWWQCEVIVNNELYFFGNFGHYWNIDDDKYHDESEYQFPVPAGTIQLQYCLHGTDPDYVNASYGTDVQGFNETRNMSLSVGNNETIRLIAYNSSPKRKSILPLFYSNTTFQEVLFAVDTMHGK